MEMRVLTPEEIDEVLVYERELLKTKIENDFERELAEWSARWRREALEYYLPLGWSFAVRDQNQKLQGYFLGQPLLFFRGHTQNLWVEHLSAQSADVQKLLIEIAYRWSRDKHLQRVLFAQADWLDSVSGYPIEKFSDNIVEIRTTKT